MTVKVLIVAKQIRAEGGAAILVALTLDALIKMGCDVRVLCYGVDLHEKFKTFLDLNLASSKLTFDVVNTRTSKVLRKSGYINSFYLMYLAKTNYSDRILFSVWDEMDFGRRALQYIHWVAHHPLADSGSTPFKNSISRKASVLYRTLVSTIFGFSKENVKNNISIFNSEFTRNKFEELYGETNGYVVYPPVIIDTQYAKPFFERENGLVYSGRISPDKNIHLMLESVGKLIDDGFDLHFHVVGPDSNPQYASELRKKYTADWVIFEGSKSRDELSEILGQHKYSIQGRYIEPFGMAAAEACKIGCLTFIPSRSGFSELLDEDQLKFDGFSDFSDKFSVLVKDKNKQEALSKKLQTDFSTFTPAFFQQQIQEIFSNSVDALNTISAPALKES